MNQWMAEWIGGEDNEILCLLLVISFSRQTNNNYNN